MRHARAPTGGTRAHPPPAFAGANVHPNDEIVEGASCGRLPGACLRPPGVGGTSRLPDLPGALPPSAPLIEGATEAHLWAEAYDRPLGNLRGLVRERVRADGAR